MSALRLYVWEGHGISSAYHDDGMLVVLAESPDAARLVVAKARSDYEAAMVATEPQRKAHYELERASAFAAGGYGEKFWKSDTGKQLLAEREAFTVSGADLLPDGDPGAMARTAPRVVELTEPAIVAFNGGGYD